MPEYPVAQLPPQDPSDYPYIKIGVSASVDGARELQNSALSSPVPSSLGQPLGGPGGYPWGVPAPGEHVPFAPAVPVHPSGFLWDNPVLILERRRSTNRGVAISCGIIELITVIIALIINVALFLPTVLTEPHPSVLMGVVILMMVAGPFLVGVGWIVSFVLALVACIQAHASSDRIQPGGWAEAKMPTAAQLAASIVMGLPTVVMYVALYKYASVETDALSDTAFVPLIVICMAVQVMLVLACILLLRKSAALRAVVTAPKTGEWVQ